jgi:hypothetical protein
MLDSSILLESEQKELLVTLVEATRNVLRKDRQKFYVAQSDSDVTLLHPGLPNGSLEIYMGDVEELANVGLINLSLSRGGDPIFDVNPRGFAYYEYLKEQSGKPIDKIEGSVHNYLSSDRFLQNYPEAYKKWVDAENMLWKSESEKQLTTIGHLCREAIQEFANILIGQFQPPNADSEKSHDVRRIEAILKFRAAELGQTEKPFLEALLGYWANTSTLIQRQEHGAQKEGKALVWEDARRIVFHTAILMYEVDKAVSRQ